MEKPVKAARSAPVPDPAENRFAAQFALARTKLNPPRLPSRPVALDRHRQWLDPILQHSLCLVHAPSGYGKSTICSDWYRAFAERGIDRAWVSFDPQDDDPARAIAYIFEAIRPILGEGQELAYDGIAPPQSVATEFINAVHDHARPLVLFLDDADRLSDPRILQFFNFVLLHCPENLHLVCACQAYPALPLAFLDTHSLLLRIDAEHLRFRDSEAISLLSGTDLASEDVRRLNTAMAGWVTGLRIGSMALRNNRDALLDIGLVTRSAQWLGDYLEENIFQHLTPVTRQFLMRCAILETLTAELCDALSGVGGAARTLTWLADQNLFVQRLDDAGTLFRIHPVFRKFLLNLLNEEGPGLTAELHRKACDWLSAHGRLGEAITHALDAEDSLRAAELISEAAMGMVEHSDIITLLGWIARLPEDIAARHLPLRLGQAWALTLTLRPQARDVLDDLRARVADLEDEEQARRLRLEISGIETNFLAVYEDRLDAAVRTGREFLAATPDEEGFVTRAVRNCLAYCEIQRGNAQLAHDIVRPAQLQAMRREQLFTTSYRCVILGLSFLAQGEIHEAARVFRSGLELANRRGGAQSASSGLIASFFARCEYERGDLDAAWACIEDRLPVIDEAAFHESTIEAYTVAIRVAALRGQKDRAADFIEHAELIGHERGWRRLLAVCALERARLRLPFTTDIGSLCPDDIDEGVGDLLSLDVRTHALIDKVRCLDAIFRDNRAAFEAPFAKLATYSDALNHDGLTLKVSLLRLALEAKLNAELVLDEAQVGRLLAAVGRGYGRTIIDGLAPLSTARLEALLAPIEPLAGLIHHHIGQFVPQAARGRWPTNTVFNILTSREIDVLTGVAMGDSNKEIARRLHLTPETVKWHLKNVMRKLKAESRAEAVATAARLGLARGRNDPGRG